MKVFEVSVEPGYPRLYDEAFVERYRQPAQILSFAPQWISPTFYVFQPPRKLGDFYDVFGHAFVCSREVTEKLRNCIDGDVETLPAQVEEEGGDFLFWNVTNVTDALDQDRCVYSAPGKRGSIVTWAFKADVLDRPMLFRVRQELHKVLVVTDLEPRDLDFQLRYQSVAAKGLRFDFLWEGHAEVC